MYDMIGHFRILISGLLHYFSSLDHFLVESHHLGNQLINSMKIAIKRIWVAPKEKEVQTQHCNCILKLNHEQTAAWTHGGMAQ